MPLDYKSHAGWGTGASRCAAPCDVSWAGLVGTLTSRAPSQPYRPVGIALGAAAWRCCFAHRLAN
eukprot:357286-Chlamydomonas_euryale.AAC.1